MAVATKARRAKPIPDEDSGLRQLERALDRMRDKGKTTYQIAAELVFARYNARTDHDFIELMRIASLEKD